MKKNELLNTDEYQSFVDSIVEVRAAYIKIKEVCSKDMCEMERGFELSSVVDSIRVWVNRIDEFDDYLKELQFE